MAFFQVTTERNGRETPGARQELHPEMEFHLDNNRIEQWTALAPNAADLASVATKTLSNCERVEPDIHFAFEKLPFPVVVVVVVVEWVPTVIFAMHPCDSQTHKRIDFH